MFRVVRFLIALLGVSGAIQALAQPTPLPIQGNLGSISGSGVPYAGIDIQLQNCPSPVSIAGYWGIVQQEYQIQANPSGVVNSTIWPNDLITCNGTTGNSQYLLTYFAGGAVSGTPQCYQVVSTQGLWNLNGPQQPIACSQPAPNPQDKTYNNLTVNGFFQGVNGAMSGTFHVVGMLTASGGITLGTLPTACTGSNFMTGLSVTLQPICGALPISGVTSWNSRTGAVVPVSGDYNYAQITNAPFLLFNSIAATVRQQWNFSQRFTGTDATPKTNIDLNAPGTGNILATEGSDPGTTTNCAKYDGSRNIAPSSAAKCGLNVVQTDVSGSRSLGVPYTVSSVATFVEVTLSSLAATECTGAGWTITAQVGATSGSMITVGQNSVTNDCLGTAGVSFMVPAGWTYEITEATNPSRTAPSSIVTSAWIELPLQ